MVDNLDKFIADQLNSGNLTLDVKKQLLEMLKKREEIRRYNKMDYFKAYDFQKKFYEAGAKNRFRFLCAANR